MMCVINTLSIYISYYLYLWFQQWKTINLKINFVGLDLCSGFWPSDSTYNTFFFFFFFYYWCLSVFVISTAVMDSTLTSYVVSQWVCEMAARFSKCEDSDPLFTTAHSVGLFMYLSLCMLCVLTCISIIVAWLWWKTNKKRTTWIYAGVAEETMQEHTTFWKYPTKKIPPHFFFPTNCPALASQLGDVLVAVVPIQASY